ncbi:MAG TPA: HD domain-containing protein [Marinilabiliaceae bacterium]|nr:HD domain-containing protein [Marinilabiliaceae bacterium]
MKVINKKKIINDPVHGFISIPGELLFDLMEHPFIQRLRRIKQLGLTSLVYPGATHTRFQHSVGCMHLMSAAVNTLVQKGHEITHEESEAVHAAILLHDLGHGPFSHLLEATLVQGIHHENLSLLFMERLNHELDGRLTMAIQIFTNHYHKKFLHQLVSSQLDMDRLDYLRRDSFYTGVSEGVISSDRIIKMLNIHNDELVVEVKGIYSIEKFLVARRLMYWQVYLHKTALVAEQMLISVFKRARELSARGEKIATLPNLDFFIQQAYSMEDFRRNNEVLDHYAQLDDSDVMSALKIWSRHQDKILRTLSQGLIQRKLLAIEISDQPFPVDKVQQKEERARQQIGLSKNDPIDYFVFTNTISNNAYSVSDDKINILYPDQTVKDISEASDMLNLSVLGKTVRKNFLCYPKSIR